MSRFIVPATLVRRGFSVIQEKTLAKAFPGTRQHVAQQDFTQFQEGKRLQWNMGGDNLTINTPTFGISRVGV